MDSCRRQMRIGLVDRYLFVRLRRSKNFSYSFQRPSIQIGTNGRTTMDLGGADVVHRGRAVRINIRNCRLDSATFLDTPAESRKASAPKTGTVPFLSFLTIEARETSDLI